MESTAKNRFAHHQSLAAHRFLSVEAILIAWFVTTPAASFFLRYPLEKSIITYDRASIGLVIIMLLWKYWARAKNDPGARSSFGALPFEIAWALLSVLMLINTALKSGNVGHATRIVIDGFWLPLALFHIARRHFDLRGKRSALLLGAIALGVMLFAIGAYEFVTGTDLFHYSGSELIREGELRVNGPFASDSSYAIICLLIAVFLAFAPQALGVRLDRAARLAYGFAIAASIAASLLPQFRIVAAAVLVCWLIFAGTRSATPGWLNKVKQALQAKRLPLSRLRLHPFTMSVIGLAALAALSVLLASASLGQRLASLHNAYGRLATWEAAVRISAENPLLGVGITNYSDYFRAKYFEGETTVERIIESRAALSPHSNPLWVAAEVGALAFALYLAANVYIFRMGYIAFKRTGIKRAALKQASRYPEIRHALETGELVLAQDISTDPIYEEIRSHWQSEGRPIPARSAIAMRFALRGHPSGVFFLRTTDDDVPLNQQDVQFAEQVVTAAVQSLERAYDLERAVSGQEELRHLASTDPLTNTLNRRALGEKLEQEMERAARYASLLTCMMIDIDNFKQINDTHGHAVGDTILRQLAALLKREQRSPDAVARYGGEEFVVLLPETTLAESRNFAERVLKRVAEYDFGEPGRPVRVTISIGLASYPDERVSDGESLLRLADSHLYRAKSDGRNRFRD